jgi:hypothetical protein
MGTFVAIDTRPQPIDRELSKDICRQLLIAVSSSKFEPVSAGSRACNRGALS